jgi:hypothetical protein
MRFLGQFLDVQRIHERVDRHQNIRLLVDAINALRYRYQPESREAQALDNVTLIRLSAGQTTRVIY